MTVGGRLANVAGAVLDRDASDAESVARVVDLLALICEDVMVVGGSSQLPGAGRRILTRDTSPLAVLVAALDASDAARVLTVDPCRPLPPAALLLALTAWPESDAVLTGSVSQWPTCAIYRREPVLACARRRLAAGDDNAAAVLAAVDVAVIRGPDLAAINEAL